MKAVSISALPIDLQHCLMRSSIRYLTWCLDSFWWLSNAKLFFMGLPLYFPSFITLSSIQNALPRFCRKTVCKWHKTQLDLNHDPYKNNFRIHKFWYYVGPGIATQLRTSLILIKMEASRISVLDLVLLQTLSLYQCPFIAAQCQDLKRGFLFWGIAGFTLCPQAGDTY